MSCVRNGSKLTPSSFFCEGCATPAAASAVGWISSEITGRSSTLPAGTCPVHWIMKGMRMPPSHVVAFVPRRGSFREVVCGVGPPLSLMKKISVDSSSRALCNLPRTAHRVIHRRKHGGERLPLRVVDFREACPIIRGRLQRRMHGMEGEVEEERLRVMAIDEGKQLQSGGRRRSGIRARQSVRSRGRRRCGGSHRDVRVSASEEAEEFVEASLGRPKSSRVPRRHLPTMPVA